MQKLSYPLLIILAILAMLGGIAAEYLNEYNVTTWPVIMVWSVLYLVGIKAHRDTKNWSPENISELVCGGFLLHACALVIQNTDLLPAAVLSFGGATYIASRKLSGNKQ